MTALAGYNGSVLITSSPNVALTDEVLADEGDHKTFDEPTASKRYWDRTAAFTVQTSIDGGTTWSTAAAGTYTIRYVTGQVVLNSALTGTPACRIHAGAYLPFSTFGEMKNWEATPAVDMLDASVFGSRWKQYLPSLQGAALKLAQFYVDNTFLAVVNNSSTNLFVVSCLTGRNSTERYEGYAHLKQDDIKLAVNALVEEGLDLQIDGQFYYFAS
jgi:hypothetical protein